MIICSRCGEPCSGTIEYWGRPCCQECIQEVIDDGLAADPDAEPDAEEI